MKTFVAAACAIAFLASCVAVPRASHEVEDARAAYRAAAANAEVQARAPFELQAAERALGDAERFQQSDGDPARVAHFAYLAERLSRIAVQSAQMRAAESRVATASAERSRMQAELAASERAQRERAELEAAARPPQLAAEIGRLQGEVSGLSARETDRGWVLTFASDMLFDRGSAALKPGGRQALENVAQTMKRQPAQGIAVEGYTDSGGSAELSRQLSHARAEAVKQVLVEQGLAPSHIWTRSYGAQYPLASKERVDVVLAPPAAASSGATTR